MTTPTRRFIDWLTQPSSDPDGTELAELRDRCVKAATSIGTLTESNLRHVQRIRRLQSDLIVALDRAETAEAELHQAAPVGSREAIRVANWQEKAELWEQRYADEHQVRAQLAEQVEALRVDNATLRAQARQAAA